MHICALRFRQSCHMIRPFQSSCNHTKGVHMSPLGHASKAQYLSFLSEQCISVRFVPFITYVLHWLLQICLYFVPLLHTLVLQSFLCYIQCSYHSSTITCEPGKDDVSSSSGPTIPEDAPPLFS